MPEKAGGEGYRAASNRSDPYQNAANGNKEMACTRRQSDDTRHALLHDLDPCLKTNTTILLKQSIDWIPTLQYAQRTAMRTAPESMHNARALTQQDSTYSIVHHSRMSSSITGTSISNTPVGSSAPLSNGGRSMIRPFYQPGYCESYNQSPERGSDIEK